MVRSPLMRPALLVSLVSAVLCAPLAGQADTQTGEAPVATPRKSADEIQDCVQANFPTSTAVQKMEFRSEDRAGGGRTILSRVHWGRVNDLSNVMVRVRKPADLKGSGVLLLEKPKRADMFVYLPDLQRVKRITTQMLSGSMFGSDFTYEDFSQLQGIAVEGRSERGEDAEIAGVPVYVVSHFPAEGSGSAYQRVTSFIETDTCLALKTEMYEEGDRLRKVMTADRDAVFVENGVRLPQEILMQDLRDESQTELLVTDIEVGGKIPKKTFTTGYLERARTN